MFENLSLDELLEAQKQLQEKLQAEKHNAIAEIAERMKLMGISIADIQGFFNHTKPVSSSKPNSSSKPKYRNPDNPDETWTGKGKPPNWFKTAIKKGKEKESMLIG